MKSARVGWVEAIAEIHHNPRRRMMGFALLYPSYSGNGGKRMEDRLAFMDVLAEKGIVIFDYDESMLVSELSGITQLSQGKHDHQQCDAFDCFWPDWTIVFVDKGG